MTTFGERYGRSLGVVDLPGKVSYVGTRTEERTRVTVRVVENGVTQERVLDPRPSQRLWNHSPAGFEWGYFGSGPAQLALAILFDGLMRLGVPKEEAEQIAKRRHQEFKALHVSRFEYERWSLDLADVATFAR